MGDVENGQLSTLYRGFSSSESPTPEQDRTLYSWPHGTTDLYVTLVAVLFKRPADLCGQGIRCQVLNPGTAGGKRVLPRLFPCKLKYLVAAKNPIQPAQAPEFVSDERRLVASVLGKDRKATAEFVDQCTDWMYPFLRRRLVPRRDVIEDILQDILLAAWQALC